MGWVASGTYEQVSETPSVQLSIENRTVNKVARYYNINNDKWFNVGYQQEDRRTVKRVTMVKVYENRALTEAAAKTEVSQTSTHNPITDEMTSTVIVARAANDAGGWIAEKTETTVTVTWGAWTKHSDNLAEVIAERFGTGD